MAKEEFLIGTDNELCIRNSCRELDPTAESPHQTITILIPKMTRCLYICVIYLEKKKNQTVFSIHNVPS